MGRVTSRPPEGAPGHIWVKAPDSGAGTGPSVDFGDFRILLFFFVRVYFSMDFDIVFCILKKTLAGII